MNTGKSFEDGLIAGKIEAIENILGDHKNRIDNHGGRLRVLEKVMWIFAGVVAVIQIWPALNLFLKSIS